MKVSKKELDKITKFMLEADKLKAIDRTGWVIRKVHKPEHVGDHAYSTALLSYIMAKKLDLDFNKCIIMALSHDINEAITGDIATRAKEHLQKVNNTNKAKIENSNTLKMLGYLDRPSQIYLRKIWEELKARKTKEAQLVDQVDKLDYILQLIPYHKYIKNDADVEEFFETAAKRITIPELLYIYNKVKKQVYNER